MASSLPLRLWCSFLPLLCMATTCCKSDPVGIVGNALECFNAQYVYSGCQEAYRLTAQGVINVPPGAANEYCGGPCLAETRLALSCIDEILNNFRFYNGASIRDVRHTLNGGCGYSNRRGDFDVSENLGAGNYYGHGGKLDVPVQLMILLSFVVMLLWV